MMNKIIKTYWGLFLSLFLLLVIKIPQMGYQWSWDEAWSYYPSIMKMVKNGPSLLPGSIELIDSRGHPLLFYFISSLWIKLTPHGIIYTRILPMLISILTLSAFYYFLKKHIGQNIANAGTLILSVQSLFLGQASLLLPEMLLTFFLILSFDAFLSNKILLYSVLASLMVLTKETGLLFAGIFGLYYFFGNIRNVFQRPVLKDLFYLMIPLQIYIIFLILHKMAYGTFFFTEHLDYINFNTDSLFSKLRSVSSNLATKYGRNVILFFAIAAWIRLYISKNWLKNKRLLFLLLLQIFALVFFTIMNFYTYRYILPAFPLFIAFCLTVMFQARFRNLMFNRIIFLIMFITTLTYSLTKKGNIDNDMGYTQYLKVHQKMVTFCEQQGWYDKQFACGYNMVLALRDPFTGYLSTEKGFKVTHLPRIGNADVITYDSTCWEGDKPPGFPDGWVLVKRFEYRKHWGEIYIRSDK